MLSSKRKSTQHAIKTGRILMSNLVERRLKLVETIMLEKSIIIYEQVVKDENIDLFKLDGDRILREGK